MRLEQRNLSVWLLAAMLALVTIALFWPATSYDFVNYDDPEFLTANPHVQGGLSWEGVKWAFRNTEQADYWAPLMWLSHMLACQCFGLNAWGHHLINVLLHATNTVLVFIVFQRITRASGRSLVLAALFAWHPLRVESVAWVTERKDVLSMLFWMLALWAYSRYAEGQMQNAERKAQNAEIRFPIPHHVSRYYLLALGSFALGLMSKPMLVTLPCVLLLLDYWPLERFKRERTGRLVAEKVPFFVLAAAVSVVTFAVQNHGGALAMDKGLPLGARVGNALISFCRYLGKLCWPTNLAVFYPHPGHWPVGQVLLAGGFILGTSVLLYVGRRRYPFLLMGWLWYSGTLVPTIGLVQSGAQAIADRFTYLPSLGVLILAIWGAHELAKRWRCPVMALRVTAVALLVLCLVATHRQLEHWHDSETLFRHALRVTENNWLAHNNLGTALDAKGQTSEAISQFQEAIRLKPDDANLHYNLGAALAKKGRTDEAISQYQEAIRLKPRIAEAHYSLGSMLAQKGRTDEAISHYQEAIRLKPTYADAHYSFGNALARKGQISEAISQFQEAIRLKSNYADAHYNLGNELVKRGQIEEAVSHYWESIRLKPDYAEAHYNLANALAGKGQINEAVNQFKEAIRLKPDNADARYNLASVLAAKGQTDEAIRQFQEAIRLRPDDAEAHCSLGNELARKGLIDEAISHYQEALRLKPGYTEAQNNLARALGMKNAPASQ
jgi:tetratricopeptide (TPR) repeat protein